jgi:hypothetical protein
MPERWRCKYGMTTHTIEELQMFAKEFSALRSFLKIHHGIKLKFTRDDYIDLWISSGVWRERGKKLGEYYIHYDKALKEIALSDCTIKQHERTPKQQKVHERYLATQEKKRLKGLRKEGEPITPKPRKPRAPKEPAKADAKPMRFREDLPISERIVEAAKIPQGRRQNISLLKQRMKLAANMAQA